MGTFYWTEAASGRLKELFAAGMSDNEMAGVLSNEFRSNGKLSRSSIIGKRHRLGLHVDPYEVRERQAHRPPRAQRKAMRGRRECPDGGKLKAKLPRSYPAVVHNITAIAEQGKPVRNFSLDIPGFACEPVALLDLEKHHCRWPLDAGGFCGNARQDYEPFFPYCGHHASLARRKVA